MMIAVMVRMRQTVVRIHRIHLAPSISSHAVPSISAFRRVSIATRKTTVKMAVTKLDAVSLFDVGGFSGIPHLWFFQAKRPL